MLTVQLRAAKCGTAMAEALKVNSTTSLACGDLGTSGRSGSQIAVESHEAVGYGQRARQAVCFGPPMGTNVQVSQWPPGS